MIPGKPKPKHNVKLATAALYRKLKPGDIININGYDPWYKPWSFIPHSAIRFHQKKLFGSKCNYRDTHTTVYFEPERIFSVTSPRTVWETIDHNSAQRFSVYRYTKRPLYDPDIALMFSTAIKMIGIKYDYGQLLDIALNYILGYKHIRKAKIFDLGRRRMVCSVGARTLFEKIRYETRNLEPYGIDTNTGLAMSIRPDGRVVNHHETIDRLFNKLNPEYWTAEEVAEFQRVDLELTSPAHFANSQHFDGEFEQIMSWRDFL